MRSAIRDAVSAIKDVTLAKISSSSSSNSLAELGTQVTGGRNITDSVPSSAKSKPSGSTSSQSSKGVPINVQVSDSISLGDEISLASEAEAAQISAVEKFYELKERFLGILQTTLSSLSGEVFDDLADFFEQLLGKKWIKSSHAIDTICMTILDYYSDHKHLRPCLRIELMMCIEFKLIAEYLISIASRVITCSNYEKRCAIAKALKRDVLCINRTFQPIFQQHKCDENIADLANILLRVADFIGLRDKSMISLEATSFVRTYPDIHSEMLFALLDVRDDLSSSESRAMADECIRVAGGRNGEPLFARLFQMCKGERKTSQIIKDVVPRLRRRVRLSIV
ncbi:Exocyst complex component 3 [Toxocara canis]|nr:Exocyst complex component 3 [Toxocara canis]